MQYEPSRSSPAFLLCEGRPAVTPDADRPQNFAETLPTEMSVRIFGELDAESLCSASRTCRLWHHIIEQSEQLWRRQCLLVRAVCRREVDGDRRDGLSWKVEDHRCQLQLITLVLDGSKSGLWGDKSRTFTPEPSFQPDGTISLPRLMCVWVHCLVETSICVQDQPSADGFRFS
ncbi:F-box only protein 48 isoform X1 [Acanthochromis polyacanthus]|uniref:F-box only protein 48 isoform X1 n=1 Tax=Acanthochromis polyacanthus TaxID=80966 RepID=UPI0022349041|nr:F-box only protein 48 isoform X1 [Acanthochromis polyacanthus]